MATDVKINDIASQLSTASRLVVNTDFFWVYMANGSCVKIPAEFVRAYLSEGVTPTIGEDGHWYVGGVDTNVMAEAVAPLFRGGAIGIEVSYDKGQTWETSVEYADMNPDLQPLADAYVKVTDGEEQRVANENARKQSEQERQSNENLRKTSETTRQNQESTRKTNEETRVSNENARKNNETTRNTNESTRQNQETTRQSNESSRKTAETNRANAETSRVTAETSRVNAEKARVTAETKRETDFKASKTAADDATAKANTAAANASNQTSACKTQTDLAKELNDNPLKQGDNGMWWKYNPATKQYEDTGIGAIGGILYPSFYHRRNHLMLVDYQQYVSNRVSYNRNRLKFKI